METIDQKIENIGASFKIQNGVQDGHCFVEIE
jgi:hypothetical protein